MLNTRRCNAQLRLIHISHVRYLYDIQYWWNSHTFPNHMQQRVIDFIIEHGTVEPAIDLEISREWARWLELIRAPFRSRSQTMMYEMFSIVFMPLLTLILLQSSDIKPPGSTTIHACFTILHLFFKWKSVLLYISSSISTYFNEFLLFYFLVNSSLKWIFNCVCVCVCETTREREEEREPNNWRQMSSLDMSRLLRVAALNLYWIGN